MEAPAGFSATGIGDSSQTPQGAKKDGAASQGSSAEAQAIKWPTIRIKAGNGSSAEIIEKPLEGGNALNNYKLGSPGMEWEVTCRAKGKVALEWGPSPEVFEMQWKFMGDNRLPSQKTGSQTAFLFGKATKVVDDPDFSIELIPYETNAKIANASGPKTRLSDTADKLGHVKSAILSSKYNYEDKSSVNNVVYILGYKIREEYGPVNNKKTVIVDNNEKTCVRLNERFKLACIGKDESYGYKIYNEINSLKKEISSWGHEYICSEAVNNKTCDLYRIWRTLPSTIPYNYLTYIWIDQATNLPVMKSGISASGMNVITEIQWDPPLSESLFSMEIPSGYTITTYDEFMKQWTLATDQAKTQPANDSTSSSEPSIPRKQGILAKLQARWKPVQAYRGLTKLSEEASVREFGLEISGDKLEFVSESDGSRSWMTIELNNDENPFQMDLVRDHTSARWVGVVEGNKLRLCQGSAFRQAKKAEPTDGLNYTEYERTDRFPHEVSKTLSTRPADKSTANSNDHLHSQMVKVLEPYQGEWAVTRHVDENLRALDVSKTVNSDEPWVVFGESFTVAGLPADHIQMVFTIPGKPVKIELVFKKRPGDLADLSGQKELRIPSIWSLEGEQLRVILGKEGKGPEKLEPTSGFKYFELTRAEKKQKPTPSNPPVSGANQGTPTGRPDRPIGTGPNLVIVQTAPGVAGQTVEPMGQDSRQMVRIVGSGANQTEIRWTYQGKLSFEPDFEVPVYEFQWKYLGTHPPGRQTEGSKVVYFQGLPSKVAEFSTIQFAVEAAQKDPRMAGGGTANTSFEAMIERLAQAKSCILDTEIFTRTDKNSVSNKYWIKNKSIRFCNDYGYQVTIKDDREMNKRITLLNAKKLMKEMDQQKDQKLYIGELQSFCEYYKNRKARFLYSTNIDSKTCDVYHMLQNDADKESGYFNTLFWIEHNTNSLLAVRKSGPLGNYQNERFQLDIPIDEAAFSMEIPPGFALDKKGEIFYQQRRYFDRYYRGLKIGVPLPEFKNFQAEKKTKASQIQGSWQVVKKIDERYRDEKIVDPKKQIWTIQGENLTTSGDPNQKARIDVVDIWPVFQVDFIPQPAVPNGMGFPLKAGGRVPSLWSFEGEKLRVAIGKEGQRIDKLEPALGIQYFELVRKTAQELSEPEASTAAIQLEPHNLKEWTDSLGGKGESTRANLSQSGAVDQRSLPLPNPSTPVPVNQQPVQKRILSALEGDWVTTKHVGQNSSGVDESGKPGITWTIQGEYFTTAVNPDKPARMVVISTGGPARIDFLLAVSVPNSEGSGSFQMIRVPSLWTLVGNQLKVAIGKEGQKLDRLEPAPGVKYFELVRKPVQIGQEEPAKQNPARIHWLLQWVAIRVPSSKVGGAASNLPVNLPPSIRPDQASPASVKAASTAVPEVKKGAIFKQISRQWVVTKHSRWNRAVGEVVEKTGDVWTITGNKLMNLSRFDLTAELEVIATEPHIQIDWIYPGNNRSLRGPSNPDGSRIPSLWAIENGKLKVVILEEGKYPEKLEPSPGCVYFELSPKEPVAATPAAGFPANFQGKWKLTKTIGPDLKEEAFNRDAIVTIASDRLQIGNEVKKGEQVQSGSLFKINLVTATPAAVPNEVPVPSLWELKGDQLRFVSGKELSGKVEPTAGIYYFELVRVLETKNPTPGQSNGPRQSGGQGQALNDPKQVKIADKDACFQKMLERLEKVQSASFEVNFANLPGVHQPAATQRHLIRGDQIRIDKLIEGNVLVTRIVDITSKKVLI